MIRHSHVVWGVYTAFFVWCVFVATLWLTSGCIIVQKDAINISVLPKRSTVGVDKIDDYQTGDEILEEAIHGYPGVFD